jgi:hypothetical protein
MGSPSFALWAGTARQPLTVALLLLGFSRLLAAQEPAVQKGLRFDLTPLIGYRTSMTFPIQPHVQGTYPRVVLDPNPAYGFACGVRIRDDDLVEFRWARQNSHAHVEGANLLSSEQRVALDQFHGDFTHEYVIEDWAPWARPFVMLSVGATHISGTADNNFARFSFGIGGGVKFFVGRHFGFRMQGEWLPVFVNPYGTAVCGAGCIVHVGGTLSSQGEVAVGPMFRF